MRAQLGDGHKPIWRAYMSAKTVVTSALLASAIATAMASMGPLTKEEAAAVSMLVAGLSAR